MSIVRLGLASIALAVSCLAVQAAESFRIDGPKSLYPTHADYEVAVKRNVDALVREGTLLREDGADLVREARRASVP